ncbi:MAG TPA: class II glutamine amidotransferase [Kofleriaceae bacterium]
MCRMVGLVAANPVFTRGLLRDAPRSLWALSREHPDGWGVAVREASEWTVHRGTACAQTSPEYDTLAATTHARVLIAHVRQRTVGETSLLNTHPFRRGGYVFAHNGTVTALPALAARTSAERAAEITGDTDSERLFAFLATRIDEVGDVETALTLAVRELHAIDAVGSVNFLFSCGRRVYAHRLGRSLFALVRQGERRTPAVVIASEQLTDEAWAELPDRTLWVVEDVAAPALRSLI